MRTIFFCESSSLAGKSSVQFVTTRMGKGSQGGVAGPASHKSPEDLAKLSVHRGYCLQNLKVSAGSQIFLAGLAQTSSRPALPAGSHGRPQRRGWGALLHAALFCCLSQAPGPVRSWTLVVALLGPSAHATWADRQAERETTGERTCASAPTSHTATSQLQSS